MQANPSLQGQTLFTKGDAACLANMDKQIFRLIGKATTLAAFVDFLSSVWLCAHHTRPIAWHTVSAKAGSSLHPQLDWATQAREYLPLISKQERAKKITNVKFPLPDGSPWRRRIQTFTSLRKSPWRPVFIACRSWAERLMYDCFANRIFVGRSLFCYCVSLWQQASIIIDYISQSAGCASL